MYRRDFDPQHEDDPDAPGLQGSNYFVKKTPHGDIRRNQPTGGGDPRAVAVAAGICGDADG